MIVETKSNQSNKKAKMKQIRTSFNMISVIALLALMVGCATTASFPQDKANMLVAAGFKTVTPKTAAQQQKLQQLQTGQVATINKNGRTYYIVADAPQNHGLCGWTARVSGLPTTAAQNSLYNENLQTAEMYQDAAMQWGAWGGWGVGWGRMGYGVG